MTRVDQGLRPTLDPEWNSWTGTPSDVSGDFGGKGGKNKRQKQQKKQQQRARISRMKTVKETSHSHRRSGRNGSNKSLVVQAAITRIGGVMERDSSGMGIAGSANNTLTQLESATTCSALSGPTTTCAETSTRGWQPIRGLEA